MSTVPTKETLPTQPAESVGEKFRRLAAVWLAETAFVSSSSDLVAHPAFREIVGLGPAVIPLLLRELENRTGHWHRALRRGTGGDPVPPADRGDLDKAAEAWLRGGEERGATWERPTWRTGSPGCGANRIRSRARRTSGTTASRSRPATPSSAG